MSELVSSYQRFCLVLTLLIVISVTISITGIPEGIGAISVLNTYYGREDIPLGAYKGDFIYSLSLVIFFYLAIKLFLYEPILSRKGLLIVLY